MADDALLSVVRLKTDTLESTWRALAALPPKIRVSEADLADDEVREAMAALLGQPAWVICALLEAVLSERGSFTSSGAMSAAVTPARVEYRTERYGGSSSPELVWSGETGARSCARATRYVIEDLFAGARRSVLVAGYSFDHASELFAPLRRRAESLLARGEACPSVRVILDGSRIKAQPGDGPEDLARRAAEGFRRMCWPDGALQPKLQYYRPSTERSPQGLAPYSMHAKCIIVDGEKALVGSANFSTRGRDNRSLEVGALIGDYPFVQSLLAAWEDVRDQLLDVPPGGDG